jgi:hypothetical protein
MGGDEVGEGDAVGQTVEGRFLGQVGNDDDPLQARQLRREGAYARERINDLAVVVVAVRTEQHLRLDLAETVEHPLYPEIGGAGRPDRPQGRARQHGHDGLGHVRHETGDPVALADTQIGQRRGGARDQIVKLAVAQAPAHLVLAPEHDGVVIVAAAQQVLGEIEPRLGIEARARHLVAIDQDRPARSFVDHPAKIPDLFPERLDIVDRPGVEVMVIAEGTAPAFGERHHEMRQVGRSDPLG